MSTDGPVHTVVGNTPPNMEFRGTVGAELVRAGDGSKCQQLKYKEGERRGLLLYLF